MQIVEEVRRGRVLGTLGPGDPLPSVRQLAAELGVNPNTVQQAYRELEREGLAQVRRGQGTFVSDAVADAAERQALLEEVARRALRDAHRHGVGAEELIAAIRRIANPSDTEAG